jgi:hypothetical protein
MRVVHRPSQLPAIVKKPPSRDANRWSSIGGPGNLHRSLTGITCRHVRLQEKTRGVNELYSDSEFCNHSEFPQARRVCAARTNRPQMAPLSPPHGGAPRVTDGGRNRAVAGLPVPVPRTLLLLAARAPSCHWHRHAEKGTPRVPCRVAWPPLLRRIGGTR